MIGWQQAGRSWLRWFDERRSIHAAIRAWREVLPGDSRFGDPLSTTGADPQRVLARQVWTGSEGRWGALAEVALAVLQVADWAGSDLRSRRLDSDVAILFTDLVGFSSWALEAGDRESLRALRSIDAIVSAIVAQCGGEVVKRLGDGTMAVFPEVAGAVHAAEAAITAVGHHRVDGYRPQLRAGLHCGTPQQIGSDYIGVDVNIAARLCEAARAGEVLMSEAVYRQLDGAGERLRPRRARGELDGVPEGLALFSLGVNGGDGRRRR